MLYDFFARIVNSKDPLNTTKRGWLTVGIIAFIIAIIAEISIGNNYSLGLLIPLVYLCHLRHQMGGKKMIKDVMVHILPEQEQIIINIQNGIIYKKSWHDVRYTINKKMISTVEYDDDSNLLSMVFRGAEEICSGDLVLRNSNKQKIKLELLIPPNIWNDIQTICGF